MIIELKIKELVIHGLEPGQRHRAADALENELGRLISEQGVPAFLRHEGAMESLDLGSFDISFGADSRQMGIHAARAIYKGLDRGKDV
ncbi:hypothetical protein [Methanothrix soehngenii]|jgi:hypothetical protein|uniref:hypothetical protein n=1 Tax=Methanothrix soehngenii TaxID=2223 RepID=UPI002CC6DB55|nr:hypothetical protein [Methanothrix soehngenii]HOS23421.1 hypothetical protein [Methanothrix soehngenii]HPL21684.1 hypothetical protein [Methanothrix soehngenii]